MRENINKNKTGSKEAPRQQQQWRPKTNNSTTQPANCEVPKEKKEQEEKSTNTARKEGPAATTKKP
jgi:hypothetical protein